MDSTKDHHSFCGDMFKVVEKRICEFLTIRFVDANLTFHSNLSAPHRISNPFSKGRLHSLPVLVECIHGVEICHNYQQQQQHRMDAFGRNRKAVDRSTSVGVKL